MMAEIHTACKEGDLSYVQEHIKAKSDVDSVHNDETPLYTAAMYDRADIIKELVDAGADLNWTDKDGWTPLMVASLHDNVDAVKELVSLGAKINIVEDTGMSAVFLASLMEYEVIADILIKSGAFWPEPNTEFRRSYKFYEKRARLLLGQEPQN